MNVDSGQVFASKKITGVLYIQEQGTCHEL